MAFKESECFRRNVGGLQFNKIKLVEQSYRNYHKSKQLLEQAKHRVEQLIEEAVTK